MPGGDGTGPNGMGPMTGRAAGYCAGNNVPGYMTTGGRPGLGRGFGFGYGRAGGWGGRGRRNQYYATGLTGWQRAAAWGAPGAPNAAVPWNAAPTREQQLELLKNQAESLENALDGVRRQIEELGKEDKQPTGSV